MKARTSVSQNQTLRLLKILRRNTILRATIPLDRAMTARARTLAVVAALTAAMIAAATVAAEDVGGVAVVAVPVAVEDALRAGREDVICPLPSTLRRKVAIRPVLTTVAHRTAVTTTVVPNIPEALDHQLLNQPRSHSCSPVNPSLNIALDPPHPLRSPRWRSLRFLMSTHSPPNRLSHARFLACPVRLCQGPAFQGGFREDFRAGCWRMPEPNQKLLPRNRPLLTLKCPPPPLQRAEHLHR